MNLRKAENYTIGLDLGTGSVGWAVVDEEGRLYHFKGQPTWGSRLFPSADTAASTRLKRGQRRRYDRRRQRLDALQEPFLEEMSEVDPEFFIRLRQSRLLLEDKAEDIRDFRWPLFNETDFTEAEYYRRFPTIYHLRKHLMESDQKEDVRLVYLALHHIVKYRGNFLHEDEGNSLSAANANAIRSARELAEAFVKYATDVFGVDAPEISAEAIEEALDKRNIRRRDREQMLQGSCNASSRVVVDAFKQVSRACVGYKVDYSKLFYGLEAVEGTSFSLADDEKAESFADDLCPDEGRGLFDAIRAAYSSYVLSGILNGASGISDAMVASYDRHHEDLAVLKSLFREHLPKEQYDEFFRGETDERGRYDINKLRKGSYTSYIEGERLANGKGTSHEDLIKKIKDVCGKHPAITEDSRYLEIRDRLYAEESDFLVKQRVRSNGAIPYQLHLEEMVRIIDAQGPYHPCLAKNRELFTKLVSMRIPYYVGPLNGGHDPNGPYGGNSVDPTRKFGWSRCREGMEGVSAHPWNVEEVIDTDVTAERFIRRMTGTCSYLYGEQVLPRHSLLYEEFCVLNELNGSKWSAKGGAPKRFDHVDKEQIVEDLFKGRRGSRVSYKAVQQWIFREHGVVDAEVVGGQGETGYESKLNTYHDFCKIFNTSKLEEGSPLSFDELEEIVLWNTVFEDRAILRRKLREKYGPEGDGRLTVDQIKKIVNKRYTGWGRLSKRLLTGVRVPASVPSGHVSIMDVLRYGNPHAHLRQMVLVEVLRDRDLDFDSAINAANERHFQRTGALLSVDDMQGSPANRRAVNQALRILEEIIGIAGKDPARICIEVTRDDDWRMKGQRTASRYKQLRDALTAYHSDAALLRELDDRKSYLDDDALMLYFQQQGRCMYSGQPLDINMLQTYQIDHILPQSYIKDDSIDNRVLVKSSYNQRKLDSLLLEDDIIDARFSWWKALRDAKMLSEKKFNLLTCRSIGERQVQGFINRQLVETSQVVKFVRQVCEQRYKATDVVSVRASVSHGIRDNLGLVKCRKLNNYHHAHDAFLACQVSDFVGRCYPDWQDGFKLTTMRKYLKSLGEKAIGRKSLGHSGFIADSFSYSTHIDERTGEILWDSAERCAYIRSALGYKTCFISRMTEIQNGAFWDETVYSPRDTKNGKNLSVPLKSSKKSSNFEGVLNPKKYGGVSSVKQAYWFIFAAKDKRGKHKFFFEGVPIYLASNLDGGLQQYADAVAGAAGCRGAIILRDRVPLRQKFELDGTPYYLYGSNGSSNEIRPALELYERYETTAQIFSNACSLSEENLIDYFDWIVGKAKIMSPKLAAAMRLEERRAAFWELGFDDKIVQLRYIINKINGTSQTVNLKMLGGAATGGNLRISLASNLPSIVWIDQSVTGMYEKRTTFEDLCRGL